MTRWRTNLYGKYYYIDETFQCRIDYDFQAPRDNEKFLAGNYFDTSEEAETVAEKFRAVLKEHHEAKNLRENEFLGRNVSDCDFPIRAIHQLENAGITTVSQLVTFTRKDLRKMGVGPKTIVQIEEALNGMGLSLNY